MNDLPDSSKAELESATPTEPIRLPDLSMPDVSNIELGKRVALLELENERLRSDLENARIELNARIAANQGLKGKITELYVKIQTVVQEKQKLQNTLTDTRNHLSAAETSAKWYQSQVHNLQASRKTLQLEIVTYQGILKQRQQTIMEVNAKYKELNSEYTKLLYKYQKEKQELEEEIRTIQTHSKSNSVSDISDMSVSSALDISAKLEAREDELRDVKAELKALEQRLLGNEISKMSIEKTLNKQSMLISSMEQSMQKSETEKNQTADLLRKTQFEIQKLKSENEALQVSLLSSKQEQSQIEDAIFQLKAQLTKMITQYKILKTKNAESEEKLKTVEDVMSENKRLRKLAYEANNFLIRRLRQEKHKVKSLESKIYNEKLKDRLPELKSKTETSLHECLKQVLIRNKDLKDQLKALSKMSEETVDEGYADSCTMNSMFIDIPSPPPIDAALLNAASSILLRTKQFCDPIQAELDHLHTKLSHFQEQCVM